MRLIDADALLNDPANISSNEFGDDVVYVEDINNAPTVERPHGEWVFHKYDKDYECSNCHVRFDRTQIYTEKRFENALWSRMEIFNYCPNCGADMRKEGEKK